MDDPTIVVPASTFEVRSTVELRLATPRTFRIARA
jgi:hypothetical protein